MSLHPSPFILHSPLSTLHSPLFMIVLCIIMLSCTHPQSISDFTESSYTPEYASGFTIKAKPDSESTLISVTSPWQGADSVPSLLLVARTGEKASDSFPGQILDGEAKRIVAMSSTHVALLDALGATDRIVGVSGIDYIANPEIQKNRKNIADVGYEGNIDYEALLAVQPDLVLLYGVDGANSMEAKLRELRIPFIYVGDYLEESPLGKAEWIIPIAEIIGKREMGEKVFAGIADRYNSLKHKVADNVIEAPSVMLNVPYGDSWFMPSASGYMARLISDAGADYIYKKDTGNVSAPIDLEEAYRLTSQADFWLNVDRMASLPQLAAKCPKFIDTRVFRNGYVFNNTLRANPAGGNDFFESGIVNPDLILHDLIRIFHPELLSDSIPLSYYRKL